MQGNAFVRKSLFALAVAIALGGTAPNTYAQDVQPRPGAGVGRDEGHDGSGHFNRGFRRVSLGRDTDSHDGSGRYDYPGQRNGTEAAAPLVSAPQNTDNENAAVRTTRR